MNNDLLLKMYDLSRVYIETNEKDLEVYNEMVMNNVRNEELKSHCMKMETVVRSFYALRELYFEYKNNPRVETEEIISKSFQSEFDKFLSDVEVDVIESSDSSEFPKCEADEDDTQKLPELDAETEEDSQEFPDLEGDTEEDSQEFPELEDETEDDSKESSEDDKKEEFPQLDEEVEPIKLDIVELNRRDDSSVENAPYIQADREMRLNDDSDYLNYETLEDYDYQDVEENGLGNRIKNSLLGKSKILSMFNRKGK